MKNECTLILKYTEPPKAVYLVVEGEEESTSTFKISLSNLDPSTCQIFRAGDFSVWISAKEKTSSPLGSPETWSDGSESKTPPTTSTAISPHVFSTKTVAKLLSSSTPRLMRSAR